MAKLIYFAIASLDGYINDEGGGFDWAAPDDEVHAFVNDLERGVGTYLYGRRMYEVMRFWETLPEDDASAVARDFAGLWRATDKVVYSSTLAEVSTARTRIERAFDPEAVRRAKAEAAADLTVGGPGLAASAFAAGLVDELQLLTVPAIVGGGTRALPDGVRLDLELADLRRFTGGAVFAGYHVRS
jgi:dihydrofolate reductase